MTRTALLIGALLGAAFSGCAVSYEGALDRVVCVSDDDCSAGQVCFPDGCGDPGTNIAVEVQPSAASGQLAQDFEVFDVRPVLDFQAAKPSVLQGEISQYTGTGHIPLAGEVTISAMGESILIPGRVRSAQATVSLEQGAFSVPIPAGQYTVAVQSAEPATVPLSKPDVIVQPGDAAYVDFTMPALAQMHQIDGKLLRDAQADLAVETTAMEVQAFDVVTRQPLSRKTPVSSGQPGSTGEFTLYLAAPRGTTSVHLKATARDASAFVPSKVFPVGLFVKSQHTLELGDYGTPVSISGVVTGTDTRPLPNATVYVEGQVGGGGTWQSGTTTTNESGEFTLQTLPSGDGGDLRLWIVPPSSSTSGLLSVPVEVPAGGTKLGAFVAPDKIPVAGQLFRPDGQPAAGVPIEARAVEALEDYPVPDGVTRGSTLDTGAFTLRLDPGVYRFDFLPTDGHPRSSRFVTVRPEPGFNGEGVSTQQLPPFALSRGRRVTGKISSIPDRLGAAIFTPAPYATVKFFRVTTVEGRPVSFLLAEGVADASGAYSVLLPTRDPVEAPEE